MKDHTTHHDDCGCVSAKLASAQAEALSLREALENLARLGNGAQYGNSDGNRIAQAALATPPGDMAALRALLLEAFKSGEGMAGDSSMYHNMSAAECEAAAIGCVDCIMGGS